MTFTETQMAVVLGAVAFIVTVLIIALIQSHRTAMAYRTKMRRYEDSVGSLRYEVMDLQAHLKMLRREIQDAREVELTDAEIAYLHQSLGLKPPA